ncbi:uncharacterized protein LOC114456802 [Gouania willdenowi]|uniref:uncharacterized protein LOC114456802 n=1 Tax=Gouania willdenowi TaxID=441366 RepID=UPI0010549D0C|nr:uncharacterized protein LOC114456802 [Gouania willdenowi]
MPLVTQGSTTISEDVQEEIKSESVSALNLDSDANNLQMIKNEDFSRGIQLAESAVKTKTLTDGYGEAVTATTTNNVSILDSKSNRYNIVKNENFFEGVQKASECTGETSTLTNVTGQRESAFKTDECEAAGETVSLTDDKDEQAVSTKNKDVQDQNQSKETSDSVLDLDLKNLQMVKNKDFREGIQATEPANEKIPQVDGNVKSGITSNIEELQEPKECEAPRKTLSLTDGKNEQVGSTKSKDVQEQNESKEISVLVLDSNPNNLQMVKNNDFRESIQTAEPPNETIAQTDSNGKPMIASNIKELQEPKECEGPYETVSLTDGKDEQEESTKRKHVQEQNYSINVSASILDSDPNNIQMVKPENETISQTDGNGKPMIAPNIEELQEPKECEAPCETVPLTDGKDEQVGSTKTKDVQEQNESKEISIFALHSEPNKLQIVRSENSYEITQSTEPVDETVTLTEGNGGPMIATYIKDVQEPKECEAAGEVVSLTDGKDEQVVSNKSKDAQEQNERKEISVFVLDSDPNNLQMVKNNDFRESIQAAEPANETIAQIDGTDKPVIPLNIEELQEPKVYEAPCETVSLTDGKDEQVGFTKRNDVQEQNESKEISIFVLHSEPNKLQIVRSENSYEVTQSTEPVDETVTLTEGNGGPMIATYIKDVQEPKDCEAAGEAVSLTDGKDEQLVSTKSKDVQEQNERKEISVFVLDSDPNNLQMVKNNDFRESFQAAEPANEAIAQIDGTDKPMIAPNIEELQEPKENEAAGEAVSLTDGKDEQVVSTKSKDVQEQNERKEISVLDSDPNNLQMVKNNDFRESIQAAEPANETIAQIDGTDKPVIALNIEELQEPKVCEAPCETVSLTDGKDEQVVSTKSQDVQEQNERKEISVLDSDSNNLQMVTNNDFRESIQAAEAANETIAQTDGNGKPVITYNIAELQEPKECEAAVETVSMTGGKDKKVVSTKTKNVQEQNENKKVSALVLDSEPNNLQLVKKGNFFECIQTTEAVDETVSINDGNDEPVSSNKTKDIQEQNGDKAVLASILDSGANKLKMIKNEGFREDMQVSDQADQVSALNEGNGEPVSATTTMNNQEQEECMLLTTLILDSESKSRQVVKNNVFSGGIQKIESAPERVIPTDGKGEFKSVSEFKIVQEPGLFEDEPGVLQDCIQTVETVEDETEPSTGNQLSIGPAEEPKKFKVVLATISDSEPSPLLIPREGTEEDLSVIKNKSKERPHNEPMNMMTELFQFIQEVSTAKKENKDQPKDEILPCPKSNDDEEEPSKTEHVQEILEVPPAIILDLKAECSEFPEKDMILKDVTGAKITFCDSAPFTEGSVQTPKHLKINIVQDQDIFKAVPVTILDLEPSSPQSVTINQGSEETLKSDLKEKTLSFMVDDIKPVQTPTVKDIEVVDVVEKATLKSQVIKYVSLSKHELKIEPEPQDNAQPVEETTTRHVKEEHLVQEADDLAVGLEVESYALPKKREEPANLTGKAVIEELKEKRAPNSSEIKSFQEFSEAAETIKPNSESITQSLKTKNTSQNIQEGQRSRDEIVQEETQTEIPIVLPSDERENLTKVEPNSTPTNAQLEATSAQETGQKKDALEINQAQITGSCSPDFKSKHEEEVESAHTKQTLHTNCMPSFTEESNISHVPENTASSEEIPEKCKDSGRRSTELTDDRILSEIEINSDKEKENRPQFVRIKTATEMPQYNTNDVIPDTLIEKLSEIQLPRIAGITGETAFQKMVETVTPSAPEPITQTAEEVREMVMMHVQSVEFDDIQKIQVQDKNHDTESARTVFEPTLEVGFKEINDICQETIGEVETLSATSEIKNKVIHGENNATFEEVVLTKDPPEEMHESDVDSFETPRKHVDTATDVSDQVEDENRGVEAVVEDNTKVFTEIHTEKPEDIVQTCETPQSSDNFIHDEVLEETKANKAKYEVDASAETTTCPSKKTDIQKLQTVDSSASHSIGSEVVSQNTGVIPTVFIEPKPSFPESSKPPTVTETLRPLKQEEVSEPSVNTYDSERLFEDTHTKECEQKAEHIETTVEKTDLGEQEKNLQSTEKAMVTNQPQEEKGVAIKTEELEELKSTETPTLDVQASDSIQRMSQREMTKEELIQLEHSCDEKTVTDNHSGKEEDNDQDVWQDAMEDILTPEESDLAHSELQDKKEVEFEMSLVYTIEDEEMHELPKIQEKGDTESEGEDFDVALEQLDISRCY